ncbi:hypothetical protein [Phycicoccus sp. 3266]|uniref:hypothetical protein n=1 Tax=Phycicoccus sp. 3266 TaxID=2817751 RepID=UPI002860B698|nr:hypothetical protein [Phycicoccus sp. 3266]MDR6865415.1 hypothetical protein [Phycicoccus sp. 3266]
MKIRIVPVAAGLAAAAGIAITGASLANAAPATSTVATAYTAPQGSGEMPGGQPPRSNGNTDPSKPMRSDERLLTGDVAAKVTAAAKKKEPTATIQRVETDSDGVYEAHMVRTDGTQIIVQVDKAYAVTNVQVMGQGGPGGQRPGSSGSSQQGQTSTPSATS